MITEPVFVDPIVCQSGGNTQGSRKKELKPERSHGDKRGRDFGSEARVCEYVLDSVDGELEKEISALRPFFCSYTS